MVAANGVDRALSRRRRASRRCAACCARPSAGSGSSSWRPSSATQLPAQPDARALDAFLAAAPAGRPGALSRSVAGGREAARVAASTRSSCPAQRATEHFGLAVRDYTHSTAPNRRFPDLVTQRLLKAALAGQPPPYSNDELGALGAHCTAQEDNAAKVERQVQQVGGGAAAAARASARRSTRIVTGASDEGDLGAHLAVRRSRDGSCAASRGSTSATACASSSMRTDVERGFIDFRDGVNA